MINFHQLISPAFLVVALLALPASPKAQKKINADSLRAVISKEPANIAAHEMYIDGMMKDTTTLVKQYQQWMKQFPNTAAVPYAYALIYAYQESPAARPFLLKAVQLDPKLAMAWSELAIDAERWGNFRESREYMAKAVAAAPNNPEFLFSYANAFKTSDPEKYHALNEELIQKFPESQQSAQSLYWSASRENDLQKKIALYERLRNDYPLTKFRWSGYAMSDYFDLLLEDNAEAALKLATDILHMPGVDKESQHEFDRKSALANLLIKVNELLAANKTSEAGALLSTARITRWGKEPAILALAKTRVIASAGGPAPAYDSLLAYYIKTPAVRMKTALISYGAQTGKNAGAVDNDILKQLSATSQEANFTLNAYLSPEKVSLKDYQGKVVLLTFWFPGCGPCRGEFPHFENVLGNFKGAPVSYVGINIESTQDAYVIPFIKSSGYSFTPLKDEEANRHNLPVNGAPTNYLIDQQGRIVFKNFMIQDHDAELLLQDMIALLLKKPVS
ncbi:Thiol-disulfide isomerase or thioredoxin [Chitinophaga costaii]|uniref:Thiol-disulfide isomerase or thioredoxin n=1 Tax=Chitinophaga costaii TaxID=1335309 RepID=A0A1C4FC13_9BACT|nr:TlpA disulfide reductase family protein [Chitinophaga costaii]PUZ20702.1 hypothetical protein DCM91_18235 [Chitinophaga costaii]SCC53410.1 Thiol-disulfide isomerase or thioredoxin [Chitinophaga costaii]